MNVEEFYTKLRLLTKLQLVSVFQSLNLKMAEKKAHLIASVLCAKPLPDEEIQTAKRLIAKAMLEKSVINPTLRSETRPVPAPGAGFASGPRPGPTLEPESGVFSAPGAGFASGPRLDPTPEPESSWKLGSDVTEEKLKEKGVRYVVVHPIRENGKLFERGDEYDGDFFYKFVGNQLKKV